MSKHTPTPEFSTAPIESHEQNDGTYTLRVKDAETYAALISAYADHDELVAALRNAAAAISAAGDYAERHNDEVQKRLWKAMARAIFKKVGAA